MKIFCVSLLVVLLHTTAFATTIILPDDAAQDVIQKAKDDMEQWARAKIGPKVTKDTPPNLYQDLKTRAIEDSGFSAVDKDGKDLLNPTEVK